jgi:uncharacterized protein (TIGR02611 family)
MNDDSSPVRSSWRKPLITIVGGLVVIVGVLLLVLPGPGLVVVAAGLAILAREYHWARRWLQVVREKIAAVADKARRH